MLELMTDEEAKASLGYVYRSSDDSLIYPHLRPLFSKLVMVFPPWLSPNIVTCFGLLCSVVNFIMWSFYSPLIGPLSVSDSPRWVFAASAVLMMGYFSFDALDGQQGRRTGQYSAAFACPTTELFDHGSDSLNNVILAVAGCAVLGLCNNIWSGPAMLFGALSVFHFATWETTYAGSMRFPAGLANPTEGLFFVTFLLLLTAVLGGELWTWKPIEAATGLQWSLGNAVAFASFSVACVSAVAAVVTVRRRYSDNAPYRHPSGISNAHAALLPWLSWSVLLLLWSIVLRGHSWDYCPKLCMCIIGTQFLIAVVFLIAAEVSASPFRTLNCLCLQMPAYAPFIVGLISGPEAEVWCLMWVALPLMIALYALCFYSVLSSLCGALQMPHFWSQPTKAKEILAIGLTH